MTYTASAVEAGSIRQGDLRLADTDILSPPSVP
jgi:hypothetical protein